MAKRKRAQTPAERVAAAKPTKAASRTRPRKYPWECRARVHRLKLRLSLRDVAKAVRLSIAGLSEIERGSDPMLTTAARLAEFFGVAVGRLWPGLRTDHGEGER